MSLKVIILQEEEDGQVRYFNALPCPMTEMLVDGKYVFNNGEILLPVIWRDWWSEEGRNDPSKGFPETFKQVAVLEQEDDESEESFAKRVDNIVDLFNRTL